MLCAALQFDVRTGETDRNLETALHWLDEAARRGVELVLLPELWGASFEPTLGSALWEGNERCRRELLRFTSEHEIAVAGSLHAPPESEGSGDEPAEGACAGTREHDLPANRFELFARGTRLAYHDKVHLFSPTAEPLGFRAGRAAPPVAEWAGAKVSGLVCYDLRFPELCRAPIRAGAELVMVCAQWPTPRASHWRALTIGRAVEGQCFVLATNRTGRALIGRRKMALEFPGNSLIVAPDGEVLAEGRGETGLVSFELDFELARRLRRQVPVLRDERRDLHAEWAAGEREESAG